jgi:hypothetical protein
MAVAEIRRLRQLADENRKLKQLVADLTLDKALLQEVLVTRPDAPVLTHAGDSINEPFCQWRAPSVWATPIQSRGVVLSPASP